MNSTHFIQGPTGLLEVLFTEPKDSVENSNEKNIPLAVQVATRRVQNRAAEHTNAYVSSEMSTQQSGNLKCERGITGIICHPHSLMGGTMQNKVVTTIARAFDDLGVKTIRFNFRGVGASEGVYDRGIGETEDLFAIIDWVLEHRPEDKIWLAGFSFGAYVSLRAASQKQTRLEEKLTQLISVAPPPMYTTQKLDIAFDIEHIPKMPCPWLLIQGEEDEVVVPQHVFDWMNRMDYPPQLIRMPGASHFFHGRLVELRALLVEALHSS